VPVKCLVTGHRGFVGRHMFARLQDMYGAENVAGIDIKPGPGSRIPGVDARDFFKQATTRFDLVVHCAAVVGGRTRIEGEPLKVATDLAIDSDLFQWAMRTQPSNIVYYSSSAAYPTYLQNGPGAEVRRLEEANIALDASAVGMPDQSYGWVKVTGELLANLAQAEGLRVFVFRPFSGYGQDQDLDYPFPSFIRRALARENPFTIWGNGEQVRDFIHIDDIIDATLTGVAAGIDFPVNLCTGRGTSFNELAKMVTAPFEEWHPSFEHQMYAPVGVQHRVGDPRLMESFYTPQIDLEEGVRRALLQLG